MEFVDIRIIAVHCHWAVIHNVRILFMPYEYLLIVHYCNGFIGFDAALLCLIMIAFCILFE